MKSTRPIRVLLTVPHLTSTASPYREMVALAKYLPCTDFKLTVCSLRENGSEGTGPVLSDLGVQWLVARFRPRGRTFRHILSSLRDQALINHYGPFDIQHSLDFSSSPFEALAARANFRRFIYSQRDLNQNGHSTLLRVKIAVASGIVSISQHTSQFLLQQGAPLSKIRLIYNGLDTEDLDAQLANGAPRQPAWILSVGHITRLKRHEDAIRAVALLAVDVPDAELGIAGEVHDPRYWAELRRLAEDLGIAGRVHFLGPRRDVPHLMAKATALLLCSESEGLPWVVLEAMAAHLPVVVSSIPGSDEVVEHERSGILVTKGDVAGYARTLRRLIARPDLAKTLAENARINLMQRFSARTMVSRLANLYNELITDRRPQRGQNGPQPGAYLDRPSSDT